MPTVSNVAVRFSQQGAGQVENANKRVQRSISRTGRTAKKEEKSISKWMQRNKTAMLAMGAAMGAAMYGMIKASPVLNAHLDSTRMAFSFLAMELGEHLAPIFEKIEDFAWKLAEGFASLPEPVQETISIVVLALGALAAALAVVTAAQMAMNAAALVNPYVILAAAVVALIVVIWKLETRFGVFSTIWDKIKTPLTNFYNALKDVIFFIRDVAVKVINFFVDLWGRIWQTIKKTVATIILSIYYLLTGQFGKLGELWNKFAESMQEIWGDMWDKLVNAVTNFAKNLWQGIKDALAKMWEFITKFVTDPEYREKVAKKMVEVGVNMVTSLVEGIGNIGNKIWSWIKEHISGFVENIVKWAEGEMGMSPTLTEIGVKMVEAILKGIGNFGKKLWDGIKGGISVLSDKVTGALSNASDWGKDLVGNMVSGIGDKASDLADAGKDALSGIKDYLSFDIKINDRMVFGWGADIMQNMAKGIRQNVAALADGAKYAFQSLNQTFVQQPTPAMPAPAPTSTSNQSQQITIESGAIQLTGVDENVDEERLARIIADEFEDRMGGR